MRTSRTWILGVLFAAAGYAAGCSSDGTGPVPSAAGGTGSETTTQGAAGSGGPSSVGGTTSLAETTSAGGSIIETTSAGGTTGTGGNTGNDETTSAGGSGDQTTGAGGNTSAGGHAGGATSAGGSAGAAASTGTAGSTGRGGSSGAAGSTSAGGSTGRGGGTGAGGTTGAGGNTGVGGSTGAAGASGTASFWPSAYQATVGDSGMNAGKDCMSSCHNHGFAFAGTVYDPSGKALSSVQVGIKLTSGQFYSVFSGSDGNFYSQGSTLNLAGADIRVRDANGEKQMPAPSTSGGCNSCHNGSTNPRVSAP